MQGYVLLSLFSEGQLPWSSAKSDADCLREKENYNIEALATSYGCIEVSNLLLVLIASHDMIMMFAVVVSHHRRM